MLRILHRLLEVGLVAYVVTVLGLAAMVQLLPNIGHGLFAVRSDSMAPDLRAGDLLMVDRVSPDEVRVGDVVTVTIGAGATVTHRIVAVVPTDNGPMYTTKGDANATADPVAHRGDQLRGRLALALPMLGYLLAMLTMPSGIAALFSIGATLLTAVWLLDEIDSGDAEDELAEIELDLLRRELEAPGAAAG
jgi:signal peptidase I